MIDLAQSAGTGPNTALAALGIAALLAAALFVNRGWDTRAVIVSLIVGVASVAAAFTVFAEEPQTVDAAEDVSGPRLQGAVASLCDARAETDPQEVERLFFDRAHAQMHVLAQALDDEHRRRAGELLVAMQRVEAEFAEGSGPTRSSLSALIRAATNGLTALSIDPRGCAQ